MIKDAIPAYRHKLKKRGVAYPVSTVREARKAGLPLSLAIALLEQESGGGYNVFGHDPVRNPVKGGKVTKKRYLLYKKYRQQGLGMQGVGPMQLTWYTFQDEADRLGGCWKVSYNMRVGFKHAASLIKQYGEREGLKRYNGAGPAADRYAISVLQRKAKWHKLLMSD